MGLFDKNTDSKKLDEFAKKHQLKGLLDDEDLVLLNRLTYTSVANEGIKVDQNYLIICQLAKLNKNIEKMNKLLEDK
ncbi:hypothetical protein [Miniphocaeibacter massiliensis]|uniref:hypothetical protein n=1 Tax=Miniphocaeibacter massiliensis TaxID=2041841 RepID=UPI000C1C5B0B|nr:hypothetical protein [Miniphocaeibacter massiliensis]